MFFPGGSVALFLAFGLLLLLVVMFSHFNHLASGLLLFLVFGGVGCSLTVIFVPLENLMFQRWLVLSAFSVACDYLVCSV